MRKYKSKGGLIELEYESNDERSIKNREEAAKRRNTSDTINMLVEFLGYEVVNEFIDKYNLICKDIRDGEIYRIVYNKSSKALHIKEFLLRKESPTYIQKGDYIVLDKTILNLEDKTGSTSWINIIRNKNKGDDSAIINTYARIKAGVSKDENGQVKDPNDKFYVVECLTNQKYTVPSWLNNSIESFAKTIAKILIKEVSRDENDRIYLLINGNIKVYPLINKISDDSGKGGVVYKNELDLDKNIIRIQEYLSNNIDINSIKAERDLNIRVVKQYFSGNRFKDKLNSTYKIKSDFLLAHFPETPNENVKFKESIIVLRARENGSKYFTYYDVYYNDLKCKKGDLHVVEHTDTE